MREIKVTYKLKFFLAIILGIGLISFSITKKILPTVERVQRINELNQSTKMDRELLDKRIRHFQLQKNELGKALTNEKNTSFETYFLNQITQFNSTINIITLSDLYKVEDGGYTISSVSVTLKNDFKTILKLIHFIEKEMNSVNLISIHYFSKKTHYQSSKKNLYATLYVQNITNS